MLLKTNRLILREFDPADWEAVLAYQSDQRYLRYSHWIERGEADARAFVGMFIGWRQAVPRTKYQLAISLREPGSEGHQLIGNCGIRMEHPDASEAEIGYELDPRFWGNGYATEAAQAIVRFGFQELDLHRISAWCIAENVASAHVLEKLGLRREGQLREKEWMRGRWWDTLIYAILVGEWRERQGEDMPDA